MPNNDVARVVSLVASTAISLAAGSNYVYSAYAPQLSERLGLSATESNLIGTFGNIGMYMTGIPSGWLVDNKGPRPPILIGGVCLFLGYYPIHLAMVNGPGSFSVGALCFFSTLTGVGSCCSFGGALKMAALNWPRHRGTATALPLAAFGLSAFFFSRLSSWLFPGNTESFLLVLATATSGLIFLAFFFCRVVPPSRSSPYAAVATIDPDSNRLHRTKSGESRHYGGGGGGGDDELGTSSSAPANPNPEPNESPSPDERSSLFSKSSASSDEEENIREAERRSTVDDNGNSVSDIPPHPGLRHVDIRGWALVRNTDFWLLFTTLGTFTGVGLMTINNIGHNAQALWNAYDPTASPEFVQAQQGLHVSILSICSFLGRIFSGTSSDILVKRYSAQRHWLIIAASVLFLGAQVCSLAVTDPTRLWTVSTLTGLAYGLLFGVCPTITSETFGVAGLSTNWGAMAIAAVIAGNALNMLYGRVFDAHRDPDDGGACRRGRDCYREAYWGSLVVVGAGVVVTAAAIVRNRMRAAAAAEEDEERLGAGDSEGRRARRRGREGKVAVS